MKTSGQLTSHLLALALFALLLPAVAAGDWLVTLDGSRVETEGEWRVEGRSVVFHLPNGTLSALRLSEVDLEASREATETAQRIAEAPVEEEAEEPKPEPVLVLTDKDIPKAVPETGAGGEEASEPSATNAAELRVIDWNTQPEGTGILMTGRLENATGRLQNRISLTVEVHNEEGEVLATAPATLAQGSLVSGGITVFRARFPEFQELPGTPHFVFTGSNYTVRGGGEDDEIGLDEDEYVDEYEDQLDDEGV